MYIDILFYKKHFNVFNNSAMKVLRKSIIPSISQVHITVQFIFAFLFPFASFWLSLCILVSQISIFAFHDVKYNSNQSIGAKTFPFALFPIVFSQNKRNTTFLLSAPKTLIVENIRVAHRVNFRSRSCNDIIVFIFIQSDDNRLPIYLIYVIIIIFPYLSNEFQFLRGGSRTNY